MKNYAILRSVPPDLTWQQVDAAAIQNMVYMGLTEDDREIAWEPRMLGVTWVRSYWEQGSDWGTCLYTAKDEESVRTWHDLCGVAYAGITEIEIDEGPAAAAYPRGFHQPREASPLIAVEAPAPGHAPAPNDWRWIRTYRDAASGAELQLFLPDGAQPPLPASESLAVRRVVELRPEDYD